MKLSVRILLVGGLSCSLLGCDSILSAYSSNRESDEDVERYYTLLKNAERLDSAALVEYRAPDSLVDLNTQLLWDIQKRKVDSLMEREVDSIDYPELYIDPWVLPRLPDEVNPIE